MYEDQNIFNPDFAHGITLEIYKLLTLIFICKINCMTSRVMGSDVPLRNSCSRLFLEISYRFRKIWHATFGKSLVVSHGQCSYNDYDDTKMSL